jgi:AP-1-like transcription factor
MKEIEEKLTELQGEHSDLARSYETLQGEYAKVKQELEALRRKHDDGTTSPGSSMKGWDESEADPTDPLLFDVSAFCYEQAE